MVALYISLGALIVGRILQNTTDFLIYSEPCATVCVELLKTETLLLDHSTILQKIDTRVLDSGASHLNILDVGFYLSLHDRSR
jgi:hypothetical protein